MRKAINLRALGLIDENRKIVRAPIATRIRTLKQEVARWKIAGRPLTPPGALAIRGGTCQNCPSNEYDADKDQCRACGGCYMHQLPLLAKAACFTATGECVPGKIHMATAECPRGHWQALVGFNESGKPVWKGEVNATSS